ncbi:MAG TPA: methyltransferase [Desulfomonilaceae bacterium]|nr:methyltransferase [Desulfomonilaceae bacterium]
MAMEANLWLSFLNLLHGIPPLRWFRLALAGWHFNVDAVSLVHDHIWDATSLVLRRGIRRYARNGQRVLDMGTGHLGLLAVYCARTNDVNVVAVDVNAKFVANARIVAKASEAPSIDFRQSDWFTKVDGKFDLIFSNCPYVPTEVGFTHYDLQEHPEIWNGGRDGLDHVQTILASVDRFLEPQGILLLGIDTFYIPRATIVSLIGESLDLEVRRIIRSWVSSSEVYVIGLKLPVGWFSDWTGSESVVKDH